MVAMAVILAGFSVVENQARDVHYVNVIFSISI